MSLSTCITAHSLIRSLRLTLRSDCHFHGPPINHYEHDLVVLCNTHSHARPLTEGLHEHVGQISLLDFWRRFDRHCCIEDPVLDGRLARPVPLPDTLSIWPARYNYIDQISRIDVHT